MENQKQGHFALFRSLLSKDWAKDTAKLAMWIRLIGEASYRPRTVEFSGKEWNLQPGELVTTAAIIGRKLRDQDGHEKSPQAVTRMINFFAREGMITTKGTRFGTVITITNYAEYQAISPDEPRERPSDNNKPNTGAALSAIPDEPSEEPTGEQNKKLLEQELNNNYPHTPKGGRDGDQVSPEKRKAERIDYDSYLVAYNEEVGDRLPHAVAANEARKRRIKKLIPQLKTPNVAGFRSYVRAFVCQAKPFYFGANDTGWSADLDYLLRDATLTGVREGKFADHKEPA
ncbi:replication protein [Pantoea sp. RIT-PI-b]|uniref:replication protein n=1 Tax=Pantoea sp. RIT-PI-b TaxID=1681195 RepID=UPI000675F51A|nr:replication protein [Pantoea sp. RIT-PI-b]KNC11848.1 replication protein [Pantoea sp. RIT-PI-b]